MEQDWGLQGKGECSRAGTGLESGEQAGEYWQRELGERWQEQTSRLAGTARQDWTSCWLLVVRHLYQEGTGGQSRALLQLAASSALMERVTHVHSLSLTERVTTCLWPWTTSRSDKRYGVKERNVEGQMVVDFAKRMEMAVVNTYFKKREEHRVMYKSGGRCT
ncbi:hypothetical protein SKAU_G00020480 [Synaphobranchus kaupii]|uniref:Uncharacterized protein n=1 Tax=Synaphobranchus kaupii TaxID=118154 RepID=A0A9Q1JDU2_SYNKA|nr:hypothetical protein SKAU_G00020480 [Synaphobranchus kaupii]